MTTIQAWQHIFNNWNAPTWQPIPQDVKQALGLHSSLGMYSGMLMTHAAAEGVREFVQRLNQSRKG